jgi:hypothetical protein
MMIIIDDDDDVPKEQDKTILKNLISKLDIDTELIIVQPNSPIRICTSALSYPNLSDTHIIVVNIINFNITVRYTYLSLGKSFSPIIS